MKEENPGQASLAQDRPLEGAGAAVAEVPLDTALPGAEEMPTRSRALLPPGFSLSLIVPVFNEERGIADVLTSLVAVASHLEAPVEIIVVDDGSTDGTSSVLAGVEGIRVVRHKENRGYGAALKTGVRLARHEWICITDGDGTYPNESIPELAQQTHDSVMVVGARTAKGARTSWVRRPAKWLITRLACYLVQCRIPDINSGLRIIRKDVLDKYLALLPDGFSFTSTITLALLSNGHPVTYVPISYARRIGRSKIRPIYDTLNFIQLIVRMVLYFNPLRVFLPMSFALFLLGSALLTYRMIKGAAFGVTTITIFVSAFQLLAIGMLADLIDKRVR